MSDTQILVENNIKSNEEILNFLVESVTAIDDNLFNAIKKFQDISSQPEAPKTPMKPNNWDSVRNAFKGPARDTNERT